VGGRHLGRPAVVAPRRECARAHAGRGRGRVRDRRRVHLLALARGVRLPARQRPGVRAAGARPGLPVRARLGPLGSRTALARAPGRGHRGRRRRVRPLGPGRHRPGGRAGRVLVRLPRGIPAMGGLPTGLRGCVRRRHLPRGARHLDRRVGVAAARPHRARADRQPPLGGGRRVRMVRPGRADRRATAAARVGTAQLRPGGRPGNPARRRAARCCSRRRCRRPVQAGRADR